MSMDINQAKALLQRYRAGECTLPEQQLVELWYNQLIETGEWNWDEGEKEVLEQMMEARLLQHINNTGKPHIHRIHSFRRSWWWAAASIILLLGAGGYFLFFNKTGQKTEIVKTALPNDVKAPETNRAMITLGNGQKVYLDSAVNGTLAMQGNVKVIKLANGQIAYQAASGKNITEIKYNTLTNPRGSKVIDMTLADGSQVWLNAGSAITYPVAFIGNERKVAITGEVYFEVAPSLLEKAGSEVKRPFIVSNGKMEITVLGTHFNVNAYDDEPDIKVTLLEGSVKVNNGSVSSLLKEGQQAQVANDVKVVNGADLEQVMAWKNGYFNFKSVDIRTIMKQVARWYNVEVSYEENVPAQHITGEISRNVNASLVLKMLEYAGVHFKIEGTKIVVTP
jgi:transmembrane sensor